MRKWLIALLVGVLSFCWFLHMGIHLLDTDRPPQKNLGFPTQGHWVAPAIHEYIHVHHWVKKYWVEWDKDTETEAVVPIEICTGCGQTRFLEAYLYILAHPEPKPTPEPIPGIPVISYSPSPFATYPSSATTIGFYRIPEWKCPIHGKVQGVTFTDRKGDAASFCSVCLIEFLDRVDVRRIKESK